MSGRASTFCMATVLFLTATQCAIGQPSDEGAWRVLTRGHGASNMVDRKLFSTALSTNVLRLTSLKDWSATLMTVDVQGLATVSRAEYSIMRITNLASKRVALPTNQLVLVSFLDGTNWVHRQYSDAALPPQLFQCYDLFLPAVTGFPELNRGR
jgi:hypothetical protein